jgi:hypothetical protein
MGRRFYLDTDIRRVITFHVIALRIYCVSYKLQVCGIPASRKSIGAILPRTRAHFVSLCHIKVILAKYFKLFIKIIYVMPITVAARFKK